MGTANSAKHDAAALDDSEERRRRGGESEAELYLVSHSQGGDKQGGVVHFDLDGIITGGGERQVTHVVDQIDALLLALGLEFAIEQHAHGVGREAEGDLDLVLAGGDVGQRKEPDHKRMRQRELTAANGGEDTEDGVFTGGGVDMDAVAKQPGEDLGVTGVAHREKMTKGAGSCPAVGQGGRMKFSELAGKSTAGARGGNRDQSVRTFAGETRDLMAEVSTG